MTGTAQEIIQWLFCQKKDAIFEIKEYREKRSLSANSYLWVLVGKIADCMRKSKEEIYIDMLRHYGQSEMISVMSHIDIAPFFKYYEEIGKATLQGKDFTHYRVYRGSSTYDTKGMAVLIDGVIQEAKNLDIETLPPNELERLMSAWKPLKE